MEMLEQIKGIEPSPLAWKANVLPLNYICIYGVKGEIRTLKTRILSAIRMPIPSQSHISWWHYRDSNSGLQLEGLLS